MEAKNQCILSAVLSLDTCHNLQKWGWQAEFSGNFPICATSVPNSVFLSNGFDAVLYSANFWLWRDCMLIHVFWGICFPCVEKKLTYITFWLGLGRRRRQPWWWRQWRGWWRRRWWPSRRRARRWSSSTTRLLCPAKPFFLCTFTNFNLKTLGQNLFSLRAPGSRLCTKTNLIVLTCGGHLGSLHVTSNQKKLAN